MKPRMLFGRLIIEVDEEDVRDEEEIVFGAFSNYIVWRLKKKRAEEGVDDSD